MINNESQDHSSDKSSPFVSPRIGIVDLMVLTASMSLVFALREKMNQVGWNFQTDVLWFKIVEHICFCLLFGLPIAAIYRFIIQKKHVGRFFLEPGHWLLFSTFLMVIASSVSVFLWDQEGDLNNDNAGWYFLPHSASSLIASCLLFRGMAVVGKWWKTFLALIAVTELVGAINYLAFYWMISLDSWMGDPLTDTLGWIDTALQPVIFVSLTLLVLKELRKGPARDLWHWAGVLVSYVSCLFYPIIYWIYMNYYFSVPEL